MKDFQNVNQDNNNEPEWNRWAQYVLKNIEQIAEEVNSMGKEIAANKLDFEKFKSNLEGKMWASVAIATVILNVVLFLINKFFKS